MSVLGTFAVMEYNEYRLYCREAVCYDSYLVKGIKEGRGDRYLIGLALII